MEITENEKALFRKVTSVELTPDQERLIAEPVANYPQQDAVLAVHWHPEFIPLHLIQKRIDALYPNRKDELVIPTQHNQLLSFSGFSGVEVDCYSHGFNRKVQLLLHFREDRVRNATVLKAMLRHTFKYRASQLNELLHCICSPKMEDCRQQAAAETGAEEELVNFCRIYGQKILKLIEELHEQTPESMLKNKLIRDFFDGLRPVHGDRCISRAQVYLKEVKNLVKKNFSLKYFYKASEVIEEARALHAGIVIPHPEQFWPILLADYDVDGYAVWNPQSQEYTNFLIDVVRRNNKSPKYKNRPLLIFMGDDTHMGEKLRKNFDDDSVTPKNSREIGLQPAWDDLSISKALIISGLCRARIIAEYRERLV